MAAIINIFEIYKALAVVEYNFCKMQSRKNYEKVHEHDIKIECSKSIKAFIVGSFLP